MIFMEAKRIQYYDSMGKTDWAKLEGLLQYVKDEYRAKNGKEMDAMEWELVPYKMDTPRQENGRHAASTSPVESMNSNIKYTMGCSSNLNTSTSLLKNGKRNQ